MYTTSTNDLDLKQVMVKQMLYFISLQCCFWKNGKQCGIMEKVPRLESRDLSSRDLDQVIK